MQVVSESLSIMLKIWRCQLPYYLHPISQHEITSLSEGNYSYTQTHIRPIANLVQREVRSHQVACHVETARDLRNCAKCRKLFFFCHHFQSSEWAIVATSYFVLHWHHLLLTCQCICSSYVTLVSSIQDV